MITVRSKSIVKILFAAAVLLLFAYVIIEKLYPESKEDKPLIIIAEADSVFINVMREFGIKNTWYSKKGDKYIVKLPPDVSAEMIILDISEKMKEKNVTIVSKETVKNQRAVMELYSGDEYFYSAEFSYDKNN
ncbi:MAG: hypothetical protein EHM47_18015, partial [Ignavibacteriales bacterium]